MTISVTYLSKTGFTKKYAEWIAQELSCDLKEISAVTSADIAESDLVIHGSWIMGGMIKVKGVELHVPKVLNFPSPCAFFVLKYDSIPRQRNTQSNENFSTLGALQFFEVEFQSMQG